MTPTQAKALLKRKRSRGRPSAEMSAKLSQARKVVGAKQVSKPKKGKIRRYSTGSKTVSRRGRTLFGGGSGWVVLHHGGRTGDTQHNKIWAVKVVRSSKGWTVTTRHGRTAGQKNETSRKAMSQEGAHALANKLLRSKLAKGYHLVGANRR